MPLLYKWERIKYSFFFFEGFFWWLWRGREWIEIKNLSPINVIKLCTQRIIKPYRGPTEILDALGPNWEQVEGETNGELRSNCNIFDIDTKNDKYERPNMKPYRLTLRKTKGFRFRVEE